MTGEDSIVSGMAGRYATALFELSLEQNSVEHVENDLSLFQAMLDESEDLDRLVRSPVFSGEEQLKALSAVLEASGISGLTANFFKLVTKNRRLFAARDIIKAFRALLAHHRGEVAADVVSAAPLTEEQKDSLRRALKEAVGQDVQFDLKVDPSLLGGLVVKVGSRMIDNSLRTKLTNLKYVMKEVG